MPLLSVSSDVNTSSVAVHSMSLADDMGATRHEGGGGLRPSFSFTFPSPPIRNSFRFPYQYAQLIYLGGLGERIPGLDAFVCVFYSYIYLLSILPAQSGTFATPTSTPNNPVNLPHPLQNVESCLSSRRESYPWLMGSSTEPLCVLCSSLVCLTTSANHTTPLIDSSISVGCPVSHPWHLPHRVG